MKFEIILLFMTLYILNFSSSHLRRHKKHKNELSDDKYLIYQIQQQFFAIEKYEDKSCRDIQVYFDLSLNQYQHDIVRTYKDKEYKVNILDLASFLTLLDRGMKHIFEKESNFINLQNKLECKGKDIFFKDFKVGHIKNLPQILAFPPNSDTEWMPDIQIPFRAHYTVYINVNKLILLPLLLNLSSKVAVFEDTKFTDKNNRNSLEIQRMIKIKSPTGWGLVLHEYLLVCAINTKKSEKIFYFFTLDRSYSSFDDIDHTRIDINYKGNNQHPTGCDDANPLWINKHNPIVTEENKDPKTYVKLNLQYLIEVSIRYTDHFKLYTYTKQCQHFATGIFNYFTTMKAWSSNYYGVFNYGKLNEEIKTIHSLANKFCRGEMNK